MDYSSLDDELLLRLTARASADALSAFYDRYSRLVFSVAYHVVADRATAEEITLDVFTRVWQNAQTYQVERAKVSTWLASIARHRAIDVLRRQRARGEHAQVSWAEASVESATITDDVEEAVERSALQRRVRAAIAQLPENQRRALAMAYFQGLTHTQIAAALGEPLGTVKTRIRLAMQRLRGMLADERP